MLETGSAPVHLQKTQAQGIGTTLITGTGKLGTIPGTVIDVPGNGAGQHGAAKTQLFLKVDFGPGFNAAARTAGRTFAPVVQTTGIASQPTGTGSHEKASLKLTKIAWWHYKHGTPENILSIAFCRFNDFLFFLRGRVHSGPATSNPLTLV
jgi:hypothetical protein